MSRYTAVMLKFYAFHMHSSFFHQLFICYQNIKPAIALNFVLFQKKSKQWEMKIWSFQGHQRNGLQNLRAIIRNKEEYPGLPWKNHVEFPRVLVFGFGISKGCNTILWNFQGWIFGLFGICRGKVKKSRRVFKKVCHQPLLFDFFLE